ncbi:hypothetical protein L1987_73080 [Smallanthus sonchifolius]|uniref:Uncharacterized protein n=1 Tax=Smallanthus sonchifolius TaxID=185202 RepID=A0ACB8ZZV8_9ASTR|nr:hypothetical protein L1987_73080 [Smallanthus sonchifolius]
MDCDLYEMINGLIPLTPTSTIEPSFTSTLASSNNQMLDDWGLADVFPHTIDSPFTTTPTNNNQMLDDWGLVNDFPPTLDASLPSFTTPLNNQMLDDIDWDLVNGFYPTHNASLPSSPLVPTTTIVDTLLNNNQTPNPNIYWDLANTPTTPTPTPTFNNQNWDGLLGPKNSSCEGERLNLYQPMNENNIKQMLQNPNNNFSKTPISSNNWPILTLPIIGKLTETTTHKQQHGVTDIFSHTQRSLDISTCTNINPHEW